MPVEVEERFIMDAYTTDGIVPLEHVKGLCAVGHRFNCPTFYLANENDAKEAQDVQVGPM
jgi:hypothetical protein